MKVSEWLRRYQISGEPPLGVEGAADPMLAFWCGWLLAAVASGGRISRSDPRNVEMAIKAAIFIEERAK